MGVFFRLKANLILIQCSHSLFIEKKPPTNKTKTKPSQKCQGSEFFFSSSFWEWSFCSWLFYVLSVTSGLFQRLGSCGLADLSSLICEDFWFCCGYSGCLVSQMHILSKAVLMVRVYANYTSCRFVTRVAPDSSMSYPPSAEHSSLTTSTFTHKVLENSHLLLFTPFLQFRCWLCSTDTSFFVQNGIVLCFMSTGARK